MINVGSDNKNLIILKYTVPIKQRQLTAEVVLAIQAKEHDVAVSTQHDEDVSERVQQHDLRRHALHLRERVVQLCIARIKTHLHTRMNVSTLYHFTA